MKKISILIPQYNEDSSIISVLLDSIAIQQNIDLNDIEVIVVNDGSDILLPDDFLSKYRYDIKYIKSNHVGVSEARNIALDNATGDYVMFCDADDSFFTVAGLYLVMRETNKNYDMLISAFFQQYLDNDEFLFVKHEFDTTFIHGKVFRRQFLIDNNIRFDKELVVNEDSYFVTLSQKLSNNTVYEPEPFYLWRYRDGSITRTENFTLLYYDQFYKSSRKLVNEFFKRDRIGDAIYVIMMMSTTAFFTLHQSEWSKPENKKYYDKSVKEYISFKNDFKELYKMIDDETYIFFMNDAKSHMMEYDMEFNENEYKNWII